MLGLRRGERGFTLVELMVVLVLIGIVGGIVTKGLVGAMRTTRQTQARIEAFTELQTTAERVGRELRVACPMRAIAAADVTLDIDRAGETYRHRFWVATDQLHHATQIDNSGTWDTVVADRVLLDLADPGADPTFTYLDADGDALDLSLASTLPRDVRSVELRLRRDLPEQDPVEVATMLHLRNGGQQCS